MPLILAVAVLVAQERTTTTAVPRIVGDPLPSGAMIVVIVAVLVFVVAGGLVVRRYADRQR